MKVSVWIVRILFILLTVIVAQNIGRIVVGAPDIQPLLTFYDYLSILIGLVIAGVIVMLDIIYQKKSVAVIVALALGLVGGRCWNRC